MKRQFLVLPVMAVFLVFGCGGGDTPATVDGLETDSKFTGDSTTNDLKEPADDTKEDRQQADDDGTVADDDGTVADDDGTVADDDGTVADDDGTVADDDGSEPQECEIDADCEGEPKQCHEFACEEGVCTEVPVADDTSCSDGDLCTVGDTCQNGECVSGSAKECEGVPEQCHEFICEEGECTEVPVADDTSCSDGDLCTVGDTCQNGVCVSGPDMECEGEPRQCHKFTCAEGQCSEVPVADNTPCLSGNLCTVDDTCQEGECVSGSDKDCDDNNSCTEDSCNPTIGCVNDPITTNETISCGKGECFREVPKCIDGVENTCTPGEPAPEEICDGKDNDCDGVTDNVSWIGHDCTIEHLQGPCAVGERTCTDGEEGCLQVVFPAEYETCDGIDNDCDGEIDNDVPVVGTSCYIDELEGPCRFGEFSCTDGTLDCTQVVFPDDDEICDGIDNDCNGVIDDVSWIGHDCTIEHLQGPCAVGERTCTDGVEECTQVVFADDYEICDGIDNDCDGEIDNVPWLGEDCIIDDLQGVCAVGERRCTDGEEECAQIVFPGDYNEICDGLDNDCDGVTDPLGSEGCTTQYGDADGDGFGDPSDSICVCSTTPVEGYVLNNEDCCDTDASTNPDTTTWFTAQNSCSSFDYNCDQIVEKRYETLGSCARKYVAPPIGEGWTCVFQAGWEDSVPDCGVRSNYMTSCTLEGLECVARYVRRLQACR